MLLLKLSNSSLSPSPMNEGVRGKSFPPAGYGAAPHKKTLEHFNQKILQNEGFFKGASLR